jgi:RimJ/RimL family protein N-acetyltransferase
MATIETSRHVLRSGHPVVIRGAALPDAERLLAVSREVMAERVFMISEPDEHKFTVEDERKRITDYADDPARLRVVAEVNGEVVGHLHFKVGDRRRVAHIGELAMTIVKPWRGQGIGKRLLAALLEWARASETVELVWLQVNSNNPAAIALYEQAGFRTFGRQPRGLRYGHGEYADVIYMSQAVKGGS